MVVRLLEKREKYLCCALVAFRRRVAGDLRVHWKTHKDSNVAHALL